MAHPAPYHRLFAEAEAWPLASHGAFDLRALHLGCERPTILDGPTRKLATTLEEHLRLRGGGLSLDALQRLRDDAWFLDDHAFISLADYAHRLAHRYLEPAGRTVLLKEEPDLPERAARFRWLSLLLPPDLLLAALASDHAEPTGEHVTLATPHLTQLLTKPTAETHLHLGAAAPFHILWTALMRTLAHEPPEPKSLERGGPPPFGTGAQFRTTLLAAALTRTLLAAYLWRHERTGKPPNFQTFLTQHAPDIYRRALWPFGETDAAHLVDHAFHWLCAKHHQNKNTDPPPFARLASLYRHIIGQPNPRTPKTLHDIARRDPLAAWLPPGTGMPLPETRFAARALRYLRHQGHNDTPFAIAFWQYQRIRNLTYRHLVEAPGTSGLDWFNRHYGRISALRRGLDPILPAAALEHESADLTLEALEARVAPEPHWTTIRDTARDLARHARAHCPPTGAQRPEVALLFHFIKATTWTAAGKTFSHADPEPTGWRYGKWTTERIKDTIALETALCHHPELLLLIRGLDVANLELAIPTWPLKILFDRLRRASLHASARLRTSHPRWRVPPLRATAHAGEDYRRLIEGIRRIHEPIEFGLLRTGDRIGHALALAEDPIQWAQRARVAVQPAEERLDDLLWELDRYGTADLPVDGGRVEYARRQSLELARTIYGRHRSPDIDTLLQARRLRFQPHTLDRFGFPFFLPNPPTTNDPAQTLLFEYLTDYDIFNRGQEPIEVLADPTDTALVHHAQRWLRRLLAKHEITVEANPSSNLLIGDIPALEEHPLLRMQPLPSHPVTDLGPPVLASINADDPITFATRLADEYAHIYLALLRRGIDAREALAWLDRLREHGWQSRFSLPASATPEALACLLP